MLAVGLKFKLVSTSVKPLSQQRNLRFDHQRRPGHRGKRQVVEEIRVFGVFEGVVEIDVDVGFQLEPAHGEIVAPGLQAVAHADTRDRPVVDRVNRGELGKVDRVELGRRLHAIELQNGGRIDIRLRDVGKIRVTAE